MSRNPDPKQCAAKTRSGEPCKLYTMLGKNRCRLHGGKSLSGPAHPAFKTGDYSKSIPTRLMASYQASLKDPKILHQKKETALLKARIDDLLQRVDDGESQSLIRELRSIGARVDAARKRRDQNEMGRLMDLLWKRIREGDEDYKMWERIEASIARRARIVESERKRQLEQKQIITMDEYVNELGRIADVIARVVPDPKMQGEIFDELTERRKRKDSRAAV